MATVVQNWVSDLSMMQQSVLFTAVRGPDGLPKYHPSKYLLRWFRRCILLSAMDGAVLTDPVSPNGGSFTGPSIITVELEFNKYVAEGSLRDTTSHAPHGAARETWMEAMNDWVTAYLRGIDEVPHHFHLHFLHAAEIIGYKHPDKRIRRWWNAMYVRLVNDMHLRPETEDDLDHRLGDSRDQWLDHADPATVD